MLTYPSLAAAEAVVWLAKRLVIERAIERLASQAGTALLPCPAVEFLYFLVRHK